MKNKWKTLLQQEQGLTLAEVLVSVVILAIIVSSALLVYSQTLRANKTSEDIIDATYVAQKEMEDISVTGPQGYNEGPVEDGDWQVYTGKSESADEGFKIETRTMTVDDESNPDTSGDMVRIVVRVYDEEDSIDEDTKPQAQMENLFENWEEN